MYPLPFLLYTAQHRSAPAPQSRPPPVRCPQRRGSSCGPAPPAARRHPATPRRAPARSGSIASAPCGPEGGRWFRARLAGMAVGAGPRVVLEHGAPAALGRGKHQQLPSATHRAAGGSAAEAHLMGWVVGWKTVPMRSPPMIFTMLAGSAAVQMTMRQPAAVAMRAAVSLVAMPPVPHCVPWVLVSTYWGAGRACVGRCVACFGLWSAPSSACACLAPCRNSFAPCRNSPLSTRWRRLVAAAAAGRIILAARPKLRQRSSPRQHPKAAPHPATAHVQLGQVGHLIDWLSVGVGVGVGGEQVGHVGE